MEQLDLWFDPAGCIDRCFTYDDRLGGLVGQAPAYGSDEFNDHHFHYGHMLYAAGVLAADDPELVDRWATVADLVALDYWVDPEVDERFGRPVVSLNWQGKRDFETFERRAVRHRGHPAHPDEPDPARLPRHPARGGPGAQ